MGRSPDFSKTKNICKVIFPAILQMYFQRLSMDFTIYSWWHTLSAFLSNIKLEDCRPLFWSRQMTLVKLLIFAKQFFTSIVQIDFQSFYQQFNGFKAYDTCYWHFFWISNWRNCKSQFCGRHVTLVKLKVLVK